MKKYSTLQKQNETNPRKNNLKINIEAQKTPIAKAISSKKDKTGSTPTPDFNAYNRSIVTKTAWR